MTNQTPNPEDWIGRTETRRDNLTTAPIAGLAATLDDPSLAREGAALPAGAHWLYFLDNTPMSGLGPDGHPRRGGFLPPVALPRRMWAGGRLRFLQDLAVGQEVTKHSEILSVTRKSGRSGELVFVTVRHVVSGPHGPAVEEEHDIVYREAPAPDAVAPQPPRAPADAVWRREITPDPVLLFRYSALTFNGHRIHYDMDYCRDEEGYRGLVVHGPLVATLLMDLCRREKGESRLKSFSFRNFSPLFDTAPFTLGGAPREEGRWELWSANADGGLAMRAEAEFD